MSLLPFTAIFIIIISLVSLGMVQDYSSSEIFKTAFVCAQESHLKLQNNIESDQFKHVQSINKKGKNRENKDDYISYRYKDPHNKENSKLNISHLFKKDDPILEKIFISIINTLYSEAPFFKEYKYGDEKLSEQIVKEVIRVGKELKQDQLSLNHIALPNQELNDIWYKMLRGADKQKKMGWHPLNFYIITHNNENRKPVCIKSASVPLLIAFLGEVATKAILEKEREKYYAQTDKKSSLDENEIKSILSKYSLNEMGKYMQFHNQKNTKQIITLSDLKSGTYAAIQKNKF